MEKKDGDDVLKRFEEAAEIALEKVRVHLHGKPPAEMKEDIREMDFPDLLWFNKISLSNEDYEFNQAIKEVIQEKGNYLSPEVKKERDEYLLHTLLPNNIPGERIEPSIKNIIAEINLNSNISTTASTNRTEAGTSDVSQLAVYYTEQVELKLVSEVMEYFNENYDKRIKLGEDVIDILGNVECSSTIETENGFRFFLITLDSPEQDFHNKFWEDVRRIFSEL